MIRIDFGDASLLFPGDLEEKYGGGGEAGIERLLKKFEGTDRLDVDILHVGHHGSHNGNTTPLVEAVSPEAVVFSTGPACARPGFSAWSHGHPREETLDEVLPFVSADRSTEVRIPFFPAHQSDGQILKTKTAIYGTGWDGNVVLEIKSNGTWSEASLDEPPRCLEDLDAWTEAP